MRGIRPRSFHPIACARKRRDQGTSITHCNSTVVRTPVGSPSASPSDRDASLIELSVELCPPPGTRRDRMETPIDQSIRTVAAILCGASRIDRTLSCEFLRLISTLFCLTSSLSRITLTGNYPLYNFWNCQYCIQ